MSVLFTRVGDKGADGSGSMTNFTMSDGSTTQVVGDGQTLTFAAGSGLTATVSATDTVTYTIGTGAITVGVDDAGHDVKFFGDTASRYWLWDTSEDGVVQKGTLTVGVDDAGHDVKFYGDTASAYMLWDASTDDLILGGAAELLVSKTTKQTANAPLQVASGLGTGQIWVGNTSGTGWMFGRDNTSTGNFVLGEVLNDADTSVSNLLTIATGTGGITSTPTAGGHAVFNEGSVDADFRVETDGVANMLFVDGGNNTVGVGISTVTSPNTMEIWANNTGTGGVLYINQYGTGDPAIRFSTQATTFMVGIDNSDSDTFKIDYGTTGVGGQTGFSLNTSGVSKFHQKAHFTYDALLLEGASLDIQTPSLSSGDHQVTGLTAQMLAGGTIAAYDCVCVHTTTGEVVKADASAYATARVIGIAPLGISDTATGKVLLQGFARDDSWNWTPGSTLYLSETAGAMTHTAPSTDGAFVNVVGVALTADVVYVNPSMDVIERA